MAPHPLPESDVSDAPAQSQATGTLFAEAAAIMARLRGPGGCPWDREQTPESIRAYTLEETYEVLDAIDRKHPQDLCEELGDLLLQVLFYAQMAADAGQFTIDDVVGGLNRKLVRRHPHVFGVEASIAAGMHPEAVTTRVDGQAEAVVANWRAIKQHEKASAPASVGRTESVSRMDTVLRAQPALTEAEKLGSAAAKVGFDWPDASGCWRRFARRPRRSRPSCPADPRPRCSSRWAICCL